MTHGRNYLIARVLSILPFAVALAACRPEAETTHTDSTPRPNVVLISIDTLRPDHLHCYGYSRATSPNIDRLAEEGALFEQHISSTSWTLPAHAAMFTGLCDSVHGCYDADLQLDDSRTTLAERLQSQGYATAGFFSGPFLHPSFGMAQGFDTYEDCTSYPDLAVARTDEVGAPRGRDIHVASHRDVTNPTVLNHVTEWFSKERPTDRPFFAFIHMWDVHFDFIPPPPFDKMFDPNYDGSVTGEDFFFDASINKDMPPRDVEHLIALYDGEIAWTDFHVGKILDVIDEAGLRDSTIVVITADHGTEFFEHGRKGHRVSLYDEVIRIPLIVRYPPRVPAGARLTAQTRMIDLLPTILDLASAPPAVDVMGASLTELMLGAAAGLSAPAVSELDTVGIALKSARTIEGKSIFDLVSQRAQLYDLIADPGELYPLTDVQTAIARAIIRTHRAAFDAVREYANRQSPVSEREALPPEVRERLKRRG